MRFLTGQNSDLVLTEKGSISGSREAASSILVDEPTLAAADLERPLEAVLLFFEEEG